ncbi:MAG: bidirectional hydrogenase complex protein HoxU, partial [Chroococcales cyanobacterium metabat2.561]
AVSEKEEDRSKLEFLVNARTEHQWTR